MIEWDGGRKTRAAAWRLLALIGVLGAGAAQAVTTNTIQTVSPASAPQGTNVLVTFTLSSGPPPPPSNVAVTAASIGPIAGTQLARPVTNIVTGTFAIPGNAATGAQTIVVNYQGGNFVGYKAAGFTITPAVTLVAGFTASPGSGVAPLAVTFSDVTTGTATNRLWDFGDDSTSTETNPVHTYYAAGSYTVSLTVWGPLGSNTLVRSNAVTVARRPGNGAYVVVDSGQTIFYSATGVIPQPDQGQPFYGQDAQFTAHAPAYTNNGDGTITDLNTGLMWVQARGSKVTWESARTNAVHCRVGGYSDWRFPTIKELYSLARFSGANGTSFTSTAGYIPFIDTNYFGFAYGPGTSSTNVGERIIDCQDWSATEYVATTMNGDATVFGFNFADGRIKGYPRYDPGSGGAVEQVMYVRYVRGNTSYGLNSLINPGDGTISDKATRLMWSRRDSGVGLGWSNALIWVQAQNASNYLGYSDWRLPSSKELQSIVDYTRSPATTASAAIDPMFNCTPITNEANQPDYPYYWTGTTLASGQPAGEGVYICFGRAMGYTGSSWLDVHGAGAQRSDPKKGNLSDYTYVPSGYFSSQAPQGDSVRLFNYVRLVRDIPVTNAWRFAFVGDTHIPLTAIPSEIGAAVISDDARFLIVAGDLVQSGATASSATLTDQLAAWRSAMDAVYAEGLPVYVIRGNHEDDVRDGLPAWQSCFSNARAMPTNGPMGETNLTYSFAYSNAFFMGLDNYTSQIHRVNQTWLDQQLFANRRPHVFVYGHEPAFKAFHSDCLDDFPEERNVFWDHLARSGARVYLCGHDHFFNMARLDDGDSDSSNDLYQCIVGTGGSTNWPIARYNYNGANAPYSPVNITSVTNTYGYLLVEISGPDSGDLLAKLTWKQRTYDSNTTSYIYVETTNSLTYMAADRATDTVGDGIPTWWRAWYFGGMGTSTNTNSCSTADTDHDGVDNLHEYLADTDPNNASSVLRIDSLSTTGQDRVVTWTGGNSAWQYLEVSENLLSNQWAVIHTNTPPTTPETAVVDPAATNGPVRYYRIRATR